MENIIQFLADLLLDVYVAIVDAIDLALPSTPEALKIGTILSAYLGNGNDLADYYAVRAAQSVTAIITFVVIYKLIKILPFT